LFKLSQHYFCLIWQRLSKERLRFSRSRHETEEWRCLTGFVEFRSCSASSLGWSCPSLTASSVVDTSLSPAQWLFNYFYKEQQLRGEWERASEIDYSSGLRALAWDANRQFAPVCSKLVSPPTCAFTGWWEWFCFYRFQERCRFAWTQKIKSWSCSPAILACCIRNYTLQQRETLCPNQSISGLPAMFTARQPSLLLSVPRELVGVKAENHFLCNSHHVFWNRRVYIKQRREQMKRWARWQSPRQIYIPKVSLQHVLENIRLSGIQRQNINHGQKGKRYTRKKAVVLTDNSAERAQSGTSPVQLKEITRHGAS